MKETLEVRRNSSYEIWNNWCVREYWNTKSNKFVPYLYHKHSYNKIGLCKNKACDVCQEKVSDYILLFSKLNNVELFPRILEDLEPESESFASRHAPQILKYETSTS